MKNQVVLFLLALQFLTRIPVPPTLAFSEEKLAKSVRYYPLVAAAVALICGIVFLALCHTIPTSLAIILVVGTGILITGAFHEDGLADTWDGIGGGLTKDQALSIMKDSRIGTYGTCALLIVLTAKITALIALPVAVIPAALVLGHCLSRLSSVLVIATSRYVRGEGKSKPVVTAMQPESLIIAMATTVPIILFSLVFVPIEALTNGLIGLAAGHIAMRFIFERKLGGYTGDTLGAVQQVSELGFLVGLSTAWA